MAKSKSKQSLRKGENKKKQRKNKNSFFRNIPIGTKYLSIFMISIILFIIAIALVYTQLNKAQDYVADIVEKNRQTNDMAQLALLVEQRNSGISEYIIVDHEQKIKEYEEIGDELHTLIDQLKKDFANDKDNLFFIERVEQIDEKVNERFMKDIANHDLTSHDVQIAQINISSRNTASVASVNELIDNVNKEQAKSVEIVKSSLAKSISIFIIATIVSIVTGLIIMIIVGRIISSNLKKIVSIAKQISEGDLTVEVMDYKGKDEIGQLAAAINLLSTNMKRVLEQVSNAAQSVSGSSSILNASSKEVKEGSTQMVSTMGELATGAETQANSATDLSEKMQQFLESVQTSQQEGKSIAKSSSNVRELTSNGAKLMDESVKQMNQIDQIVSQSVNQVKGLDEQSAQISKLVEVVKDIADQTNLLALNAAIEAARAGEHGKGFAVVADEVRKLAEQVTDSIAEITGIVSSIQSETNVVVTSLGKGYEEVKTGIQHIEKTGASFETIDDSITTMAGGMEQVANRLQEIASGSQQMNNLINDIAAVSEEAAAGIEQTLASSQETSSSMDEVTHKAEELANLANQLNQEVAVFKLK